MKFKNSSRTGFLYEMLDFRPYLVLVDEKAMVKFDLIRDLRVGGKQCEILSPDTSAVILNPRG